MKEPINKRMARQVSKDESILNAIVKSIGADVFIWLWGPSTAELLGTAAASFLFFFFSFFFNGANEVCNNVVDVMLSCLGSVSP